MSNTALYRNALPPGTTLLEYRLETVLGAGGFGVTYLARDIHLDKSVAIKEYFPSAIVMRIQDGSVVSTGGESAGDYQWGLERFLQEARTLARFSHPHIVRVNRYFEANSTGYMVMDYEAGESLHQVLKHTPAPGEQRMRAWLLPLLDGLHAVHKTGFLHRDIKPSNIFIRASGSPVLLDFGSARLAMGDTTKTLTSVLTPGYAPLEQYSGNGDQGPWTDIYALGGVLYRVFAGENPPDAVARLRGDPVPAKLTALTGRVSQNMLRALEWALVLDEKGRPQSVEEWRKALNGTTAVPTRVVMQDATTRVASASLSTAPVSARVTAPSAVSAAATTTRTAVRHVPQNEGSPLLRWLGIGAVILLALGGGHAWYKRNQANERAATELARVQQETARLAREREARETARPALPEAPPVAATRTPEQLALAERELALREKELRAAEREAALKQQEEARAREAAAAAQKPAIAIVPTPAPPPRPAAPVESPTLEEARRRDPLAAKKEADFRRADTNGDGYLTPDEARDMPGVNVDFRMIDTNGDGRVSLEEFFNYRPFKKPPKPF